MTGQPYDGMSRLKSGREAQYLSFKSAKDPQRNFAKDQKQSLHRNIFAI